MSESSKKMGDLTPLQQAAVALRELRVRYDALRRSRDEPIAVVGMGCRFPGGSDDPAAYWRVLRDAVDTVSQIPSDRWDVEAYYDPTPGTRGKMYTREGAFLPDIDRFDASFFGISRDEAVNMDPQQRLLLEVSWECLENAGRAPRDLAGSSTGVFVGITTNDYGQHLMSGGAESLDPYFAVGNALNAMAGRIAYVLGLHGPTLALDTACSSSLVSVHLACQSLRLGDCDAALAGGVNVMLSPEVNVAICQALALSKDGRCKTFDASADGYGRGEGCGMVLLKRLSDALADEDPVLAVIRGSAVNHDGASGGFTVPNGTVQQDVLRRALQAARIEPGAVDYIEAHGTGTSLGDPIEMGALGAVFGDDRSEAPLIVGSAKTNLGHLESAAGIAGLMKLVLSLVHEEIPRHLHLNEPNPHIPWGRLPVRVPKEIVPWPRGERPRIAGVSSFGLSGTNAHVLVAEAPAPESGKTGARDTVSVASVAERPRHVLVLSARTEPALQALAGRYAAHLEAHPDLDPGDVCFTAATGRSHLEQRLAVVAGNHADFIARLSAFACGEAAPGIVRGTAERGDRVKVAFLFSGQGAQYAGMGRELYASEPVFRQALDRCDAILRPILDRPLLSVLHPGDGDDDTLLGQTAYTQPGLFALEYALAEMWRAWGVEPALVLGHSVGEYVAACVAGVFGLEDGLKLIAERGRLMQALPRDGGMTAVFADEARVAAALSGYEDKLSIAAVNGPKAVVLSGELEALGRVVETLGAEGIRTKALRVSHAFHSPLMEPMLDAFTEVARGVRFEAPKIPLVSNATGEVADAKLLTDAGYWRDHVRGAVRFAPSMETLERRGCRVLLEVGPGTTLLGMGRQCVSAEGAWLPSLRHKRHDWEQVLETLGGIHAAGADVDWKRFDVGYPRRKLVLPTYPFQRERHWFEPGVAREAAVRPASRIVELLDAGDTDTLARELANGVVLSPGAREHMIEIVDALGRRHQEDVAAVTLADRLYTIEWREQSRDSVAASGAGGAWLVYADRGGAAKDGADGAAAALAAALEARGGRAVRVLPGEAFRRNDDGTITVDPADPAHHARALDAAAEGGALDGVVHLASLDAANPEELTVDDLRAEQRSHAGSALALARALKSVEPGASHAPPRLWLVTRGATPTGDGVTTPSPASLWGLGKVVALECPEHWGGLVDLDPGAAPAAQTADLLAELDDAGGEDQIALRGGKRFVARLARHSAPAASAKPFEADATYWITGGCGALGLTVARWMVERGARHLILSGRRGAATEAAQQAVRALEDAGATIHVARADVTDEAAMRDALAVAGTTLPPLRGILHAAGLTGLEELDGMDLETFESVLRAKTEGTWLLDRLTRDARLDLFVCFSSIASVWGSRGQAHYAAANQFLDAFCHHRRAAGLPALAVNWGPWGGGGMLTEEHESMMALLGIRALHAGPNLAALATLLDAGLPQITVADVDWNTFKGVYEARGKRPLLAEIQDTGDGTGPESVPDASLDGGLRKRIAESRPEHREGLLEAWVQEQIVDLLGASGAGALDPTASLLDAGFDSLMAVQMRNRVQRDLAVDLPLPTLLEGASVRTVAGKLGELLHATGGQDAHARPAQDDAPVDDTLEKIDDLSDEDVDRMLRKMLNRPGGGR